MALTKIDDRGLKTPIDLLDDEKIRLGTGNDLELYHDGSDSFIVDQGTGRLNIRTNGDSIKLQNTDGGTEAMAVFNTNSSVDLYHNGTKTFNTESWGNTSRGQILKVLAGEGTDATLQLICDDGDDDADKWQIFADASTGGLNIQNYASGSYENNIVTYGNGSVRLYYDNSKKFETTANGIKVPDNARLSCGNGEDMIFKHDGSSGYITNGTGPLYIEAQSGETALQITPNGATDLRYDGSKKFETTSTGIKILPGGSTATVNASTESSGDTFVLRLNKDGTDATTFKLKAQDSGGSLVDRFEISPSGTFKIKRSGDTSLHISDTSANAVSAWIQARTAGHVEYNCYKEGVGTKYPHVFVGYTEEYARIDTNGIKFNGDTAAANGLSDYEEGDVPITCTSGGLTITANGSGYYSRYIKIGHFVHIQFYIGVGSSTHTSSSLELSGLPFTVASGQYSVGAIDFGKGGIKGNYMRAKENTSTIEFFYPSESNSTSRYQMAGNQIGNSTYIIGTMTYYTTS